MIFFPYKVKDRVAGGKPGICIRSSDDKMPWVKAITIGKITTLR
jgi:hypothetical protein